MVYNNKQDVLDALEVFMNFMFMEKNDPTVEKYNEYTRYYYDSYITMLFTLTDVVGGGSGIQGCSIRINVLENKTNLRTGGRYTTKAHVNYVSEELEIDDLLFVSFIDSDIFGNWLKCKIVDRRDFIISDLLK